MQPLGSIEVLIQNDNKLAQARASGISRQNTLLGPRRKS